MTLWDVYDLGVSWRECPPLHELVGAYLGVLKTPGHQPTEDEIRALVAAHGRSR